MGRKGVSKRKAPKAKDKKIPSEGGIGAQSSTTRVSESPAPKSIGKGEAITIGKGSKKK